MANSGTVNTNAYSGRYASFTWSIKGEQSIANNQTTISWSYKGAGGPTNTYYMAAPFNVVIDGTTVYASSTRIQLFNGTTIASGEFTLNHDAQGNKTFDVYVDAAIYVKSINCSGSGSFTLPTIPRQANITNAPNFNDEQNPTITYSNPAGNNVTTLRTYIQNSAGTVTYVGYKDLSKTGTSYTFNLTDAERNTLRSAAANSNTLTVKFVIETVIGGNTFYSSQNVTFSVVDANPTIGTIAYQDTNATTTGITQNNQIIIQNNSTLQFNLSNLNALKSATLDKVIFTVNNVAVIENLSGTSVASKNVNFGTVNSAQTINASITIYDSRGNTTTYTKEITIESWSLPTAIITCQRQNNYYTETDINVNADYSSLDNKNQITIQYQYKKTTDPDTEYSTLANLQDNVTTTFNIDNTYAWNVRVILTDLLGSTTYNLFVDKGTPIVYFDRLNNSTGFNCFPKDEESVEINGENIMTRIAGYGEAANLVTGDWNTACGTASGIYMGENLSHSPDGDTVSGWWWVIHIVHDDDYQRQIAYSLLNNDEIYTRIMNNGTWNNWTSANNRPITLYENANGTTGNVTLSDDASNYSYLEIFYEKETASSVKVNDPDGQEVVLLLNYFYTNSNIYQIVEKTVEISGTSITVKTNQSYYINISNGVAPSMATENQIKIMKVVGYK